MGCLSGGLVFGRDVEEGFRRVAEALALEHAFAEPIGGVADEPIIGISTQEAMEGVFSERVVLAQHIAVSEIVFVAPGLCGRDCAAPRGTPSSCMPRTCPSSCWLRNCSCSIAPVSCRIWVSRRSMRNMRSGAELCAVRSASADGALPPMRSLPLKMPNKPNGRSVSCAQAWRKVGPTPVTAAQMSAAAVVTRSAKRAMAILLYWSPAIPYESLRPNCD